MYFDQNKTAIDFPIAQSSHTKFMVTYTTCMEWANDRLRWNVCEICCLYFKCIDTLYAKGVIPLINIL